DRIDRPADLQRPWRRPLVSPARRGARHVLRARRRARRGGPMTATATHVSDIPGLSRTEAMTIAAEEFGRWLHLLRELTHDQRAPRAESESWDVPTMVFHVLGATESHASLRKMAHQMRAYRGAKDGSMIDAMTALQIRDRASLSPDEIVARFEGAAPRSVRARRRMPGLVRRMPIKVDPPFDKDGWRLGYLMDVIYNPHASLHPP